MVTLAVFKKMLAMGERLTGKRLLVLRTDRGGEYMSDTFQRFLSDTGIKHQLTIRNTPEQNGVAERFNRTILDRVRTVLIDSGLPIDLWDEIWQAVVHVYNRSPHRFLQGNYPICRFNRSTADLHLHLRILGSKVYYHLLKEERSSKLGDAAAVGYLVGYSETSKGYRIWVPADAAIIERCDVHFDETIVYKDEAEPGTPISTNFGPVDDPDDESFLVERLLQDRYTDDKLEFYVKWKGYDSKYNTWEPAENLSCNKLIKEYFQRRRRPVPPGLIRASAAVTTEPTAMLQIETSDPLTVRQALNSADADQWREAMDKELASLRRHGTYSFVQRPNQRVCTCKWVFRRKLRADGTIEKFKARLVARGFTQSEGVDFDETFAPVVSHAALRLVIGYATANRWFIRGHDVATAYLQAPLKHRVFMEPPEGTDVDPDDKSKVWLLHKAIYGLRQSAFEWHRQLDMELNDIGFTNALQEPCVYVHRDMNHQINALMAIYVDDLIIAGPDQQALTDLETEIARRFELSSSGPLTQILGIRLSQDENGNRTLDQEQYIRRLLERMQFASCYPVSTPLEVHAIRSLRPRQDQSTPHEQTRYRELIGSLQYLSVCTRPDISTAVNFLSRFMSNPADTHWAALKRILKYLKGTESYALRFDAGMKSDTHLLKAFSDSDYANDPTDRKSITGYVICFNNSPVSWKSTKQSCVTLSSTEAELVAASTTAQELIWLTALLNHFEGSVNHVNSTGDSLPILFVDNQGAIELSRNHRIGQKSKHIDVRDLFVREQVQQGKIVVQPISTLDNVADVFTKGLPKPRFEECVRALRLIPLSTMAT